MLKYLIKKFLSVYKPIDAKLRKIPAYSKISRSLQKRYSVWRGNKPQSLSTEAGVGNNDKAQAKTKVGAVYIENIDIIEPNPNTILFECYWGKKFSDSPLAIYRRLVADYPAGTFEIFWTAANPKNVPDEIKLNPDVKLVKTNSEEYQKALLSAGFLVNNVTFPAYFIKRPNQKYCNTWHGVPIKAMGRDMEAPLISMANSQRNFLQSDVLLAMGEYYEWATIRPYYVSQLAHDSLVPCGAPRIDDLLQPKVDSASLREKFGIAEHQKVVLYAPTWRGNSTAIDKSAAANQAKLYKKLAEVLGEDYFVLFSAHQMAKVGNQKPIPNGLFLPDTENINDVLTIVDVMVSDYSSIVIDFIPVDKPFILLTPDIETYREERGLYLSPDELPCADVKTFEELVEAILEARPPSSFENYQQAKDRFAPLEDGQAARAALDALFAPATPVRPQTDQRKRILFAPGGLLPNGITTSLKNLISNLDYERFDPYVVVDSEVIDKEARRLEQFKEFDPRCNWILRCGDLLLSPEESRVYSAFRVGDEIESEDDLATIRHIFEREARRVFGDRKFDVAVEFGGYAPYWAALIACSNADRKVCYQHNHLWAEYTNTDAQRNQRQLQSVFKLYQWFDQVVAVSDETRNVNAKYLSEFYPAGMEPQTVRNCIDAKKIVDRARRSVTLSHPDLSVLFQDRNLFRFIALGRLSPEKRYDRMIGALAKVAPRYPNAVLLICGSGPLQAQLTHLAKRLGVAAQVRFLGQVSDPYPLLAQSDVCVMSSDYEGQPMALLEALCLNKTCIGTDIPGIRSVLKNGAGHLVAPTEDALADAMIAAIEQRLPKPRDADVAGSYQVETMNEFLHSVCGLPT